ncbi:diaminobutyrate acetyltransferase [Pandoraea thiooxydans]|uniref:diaminobutyrate acetyltransferase n=1 Tax=Pandoraea thiooxydans TaxID=445709 RepID=UPI000640445B|nr:diaminobutyrate acetyltransferase [Pandoraea thiooxydans]
MAVQDPPGLCLRVPDKRDGAQIHRLIEECPPLDLNSQYAYLLLCEHFSDTCVLAQAGDQVLGFISAYEPPSRSDVLFVWQVAVHRQARGRGLGQRMLRTLLQRPHLKHIQYIETTVSPENRASRSLFAALANALQASIDELPLFDRHLFAGHGHDDEPLLRIGPFQASRVLARTDCAAQ